MVTNYTQQKKNGMRLFFGSAGCKRCHGGALFSDHKFHAIGLPSFGPGRTRQFDPVVRDVGRMGSTDRLADAYRFRTPTLRNVALTGPYGHNGAYPTIEGMVRHHLDPIGSYEKWEPSDAKLPEAKWLFKLDFISLQNKRELNRLKSKIDITPIKLKDQQVKDLVAFLHSLTGTQSIQGRLGKPVRVPSGLKVD